jgi:hypothetical protein
MQPNGIIERSAVIQRDFIARAEMLLVPRFIGKFVLDILPAALASVIGGFLFTQYQSVRAVTQTATEQVTPASAEMMAVVRDEHAMMMDYLKSQMVAEKSRADAEDAARAAAQAKAAAGATADTDQAGARPASDAPTLQIAVASVTSQAASDRTRRPVAAVPRAAGAPLVIAQADQGVDQVEDVAPGDRLASDPNSLLAKTLDLKDHVVAATRHVVAAIGGVLASVGESIGGSASSVRQFNPAS